MFIWLTLFDGRKCFVNVNKICKVLSRAKMDGSRIKIEGDSASFEVEENVTTIWEMIEKLRKQ